MGFKFKKVFKVLDPVTTKLWGKMNKKKDGTPHEAPNTAQSSQMFQAIHVIGEGVLAGFGNQDNLLKSLYLNDTPVQNRDGSFNFNGVQAYFQAGTGNQSYFPDFRTSENTHSVATELKKDKPIARTVNDPLVSQLRITLGVNQNYQVVGDKGEIYPYSVSVKLDLIGQDKTITRTQVFTEKGGSTYYHDVVFDELPKAPFRIVCTRLTDDDESTKTVSNTYFSAYTEIIPVLQSFPHCALLAVKMDAASFGSSLPKVNLLAKGRHIRVPNNYDPVARKYVGVWDGRYQWAFSDNPAWIVLDILTNNRFSSIAQRLDEKHIDKWALYEIAQYCDEWVDDGFGGKEPRFSCHIQMMDNNPRNVGDLIQDLCSVFTGMGFWNGNSFTAVVDKASDAVADFACSNVVDGQFTYASAALKTIYTAVNVRYRDKNELYREKTEYVANEAAIERFGLNVKTMDAFGCTSQGQAARIGQWVLNTSLMQTNTVSFSVGRDGLLCQPYDVIRILDDAMQETAIQRLVREGKTSYVDRYVDKLSSVRVSHIEPAKDYPNRFYVYLQKPKQGKFDNTFVDIYLLDKEGKSPTTWLGDDNSVYLQDAGDYLKFSRPFPNELRDYFYEGQTILCAPANSLSWDRSYQTERKKLQPTYWRVMRITENVDDGTYQITAVQQDNSKYAKVDKINLGQNVPAVSDKRPPSDVYHTENGQSISPEVSDISVSVQDGRLQVNWQTKGLYQPTFTVQVLPYSGGDVLQSQTDLSAPQATLQPLGKGSYSVVVYASDNNNRSARNYYVLKIDYMLKDVMALVSLPDAVVSWTSPTGALLPDAQIEVWVGQTDNREQAVLLDSLPVAQTEYVINDWGAHDTAYVWLRVVDGSDNNGAFTDAVLLATSDEEKQEYTEETREELKQTLGHLGIDQLAASARLPHYKMYVMDDVITELAQMRRQFALTMPSLGSIQFSPDDALKGRFKTVLFEMKVNSKTDKVLSMQLLALVGFATMYVNGEKQLDLNNAISVFDVRLQQGDNLLQVVLNANDTGLAQLYVAGDVIDNETVLFAM